MQTGRKEQYVERCQSRDTNDAIVKSEIAPLSNKQGQCLSNHEFAHRASFGGNCTNSVRGHPTDKR
jgi:hypothetical protein